MENSEPRIVLFHCNWAGRYVLDVLGRGRTRLPGKALPVQVSCLGRMHPGLVLKALEGGADGVLLLGCPEEACRYGVDGEKVSRKYAEARDLAVLLGLRPEQVRLLRVAPEETEQVLQVLEEMATVSLGAQPQAGAPQGRRPQ
ncbi:MAG: hydrogenase iron-sulfur subunit [Anaerolineae bacterium]